MFRIFTRFTATLSSTPQHQAGRRLDTPTAPTISNDISAGPFRSWTSSQNDYKSPSSLPQLTHHHPHTLRNQHLHSTASISNLNNEVLRHRLCPDRSLRHCGYGNPNAWLPWSPSRTNSCCGSMCKAMLKLCCQWLVYLVLLLEDCKSRLAIKVVSYDP